MLLFSLLCLTFARPSFVDVPKEQLAQETIPLLEQENAVFASRIQAKKNFFTGTGTFAEAFWEISSHDLFREGFLKTQKNTILVQNRQRLTQSFSPLVGEDVAPKLAQTIAQLVEKKWHYENELDALNLHCVESLIKHVKQHSEYFLLFHQIKDENERILKKETSSLDNEEWLSAIVIQQRHIQQIQQALIFLWFHDETERFGLIIQDVLEHPERSKWTYTRQKNTLLLLEPWINAPEYQKDISNRLAELEEENRSERELKLREEWLNIQKNWSSVVSNWTEKEARIQLEEYQKQKEELPKDAFVLHHTMLAFQIDELQKHIEFQSGIRTKNSLRESQERLAQAKQKEREESQNAQQKRIRQEVIRLREIETLLRADEVSRHAQMQERIEEYQKERKEIESLFSTWKQLPPLDPNKRLAIQKYAAHLYTYKEKLQKEIVSLDTLQSFEPVTATENHPSIEQAIFDVRSAVLDQADHLRNEQHELFALWIETNEHIAAVHRYHPRDLDGKELLGSLQFEWSHNFLVWETHIKRLKSWFQDINHLFDIVRMLFWGIILWGIWRWVLHRIIPIWQWGRRWIHRQDRLQLGHVLREEKDTKEQQLFITHVFYFFSFLILHMFLEGTPFRVLSSVFILYFSLLLSSSLSVYWNSDVKIQTMFRTSLVWFSMVVFGWNVLEECTKNLLFAYQGTMVLQWVQTIVLLFLLVLQLGVWSSFLGKKSEDTVGLITLKRIHAQFSEGIIGARIRSLLSLLILFFDLCGRVIFWCIEHSSFFGSTLARNALEETASVHDELLAFDSKGWSFHSATHLKSYEDKILQSIALWKKTKKRGSIVITADEGMGKSHLLASITQKEQDLPIHLFDTSNVFRDDDWDNTDVLCWLARSLDLDPSSIQTSHDMIQALQDRPPTIFGLDNVHHIFLRIVEGFVVLDSLFTIIQETSNRHCWLLTCHLPTWKFITAPANPVQSNFFQSEVYLEPWTAHELRGHILDYVAEQGKILDFSSLTTLKNPQSVHRAEMSYWRLLTDASKGNPSTAFELFLLSLFYEKELDTNILCIKLFPLLKTTEIQKLDDMSCFVLSSIMIHQQIRYEELCRSLQIHAEVIQSICKNLVDMDIIVHHNQEYAVHAIWYPWVEKVLLQKRFMSMGY